MTVPQIYNLTLLMGVFENFPRDKSVQWYYDRRALHTFFHQQKKHYPHLLKEMHFYSQIGGGFHSSDLEEALSNLRGMGTLVSWGSHFNPQEYYRGRRSEMRDLIHEVFPDYFDHGVNTLSEKFQETFSTDHSLLINKLSREQKKHHA